MLKILVLGAAAGGGFPQWNSHQDGCNRARRGDPNAKAQSQSSIAVSVNGKDWHLFNASPDLRQQFFDNPQMHPQEGIRHSPVKTVTLTNGDVDHIAGLLIMRESHPFAVYATERVLNVLNGNSIFRVLNPDFVDRRQIRLSQPFELTGKEGQASGITVEFFPVPGKVALYLEDAASGENFGTREDNTVGVKISSKSSGEYFYYIPGCAEMPPELAERLDGAPLVLFDGTLWKNDEMISMGTKVPKTGQRMGHMSMSGPDGTIASFAGLEIGRKIFIHINNTNPVLLADSDERKELEKSGWELARDGMEISL